MEAFGVAESWDAREESATLGFQVASNRTTRFRFSNWQRDQASQLQMHHVATWISHAAPRQANVVRQTWKLECPDCHRIIVKLHSTSRPSAAAEIDARMRTIDHSPSSSPCGVNEKGYVSRCCPGVRYLESNADLWMQGRCRRGC